MKPGTARMVMIVISLAIVTAGMVTVNSFFGASIAVGLLLIVLPFLLLSYLLPRLLPVKCPRAERGCVSSE